MLLLIFKFLRPKKSQDGSSSKLVIVIKIGKKKKKKKKNYTNRYSEYVLKNIFFLLLTEDMLSGKFCYLII